MLSKREAFDEAVQLGLERRLLFAQLRLPVAQYGEALLVLVELAGIGLYLLLLAADGVQALNVPADSVLVRVPVAGLPLDLLKLAINRGNLRFLVRDALELLAGGRGQAAVLNVGEERVRAEARDGVRLVENVLLVDDELLGRAGA